ncbi:MAG: DNA topology modulation protein [Clostridiales bacterium]|nr:DNA topology modulation protein [Clostridiales bacterium]
MKIAVIGYSGAGKSALAKRLAAFYDCPLLYLDTVQFTSGWRERDREQALAIVAAFLQNPAWVIDGNYRKFYQQRRMEEADRIIFLRFSRLRCFWQAFGRYLRNRRRTRESMAAGCNEKFDWEFVRWILWEGRTKEIRGRYADICRRYADKVTVCRNRKEVSRLLEGLTV